MMKLWFYKDFNLLVGEFCLELKVICECKFLKLILIYKRLFYLLCYLYVNVYVFY